MHEFSYVVRFVVGLGLLGLLSLAFAKALDLIADRKAQPKQDWIPAASAVLGEGHPDTWLPETTCGLPYLNEKVQIKKA